MTVTVTSTVTPVPAASGPGPPAVGPETVVLRAFESAALRVGQARAPSHWQSQAEAALRIAAVKYRHSH